MTISNVRAIICEDDVQLAEQLSEMIARRIPGMSVNYHSTNGADAVAAIRDYGGKVLLLDTSLIGEDVRKLTQEAVKEEPLLIVLWMSDYKDTQLENIARSCGVSTILEKPVRADELTQAIETALEEESRREAELAAQHNARKNRLNRQVSDPEDNVLATRRTSVVKSQRITVNSPKGGVGKTTLAAHLAAGLASSPLEDFKVVLVDLDLQWGNIKTVLGHQLDQKTATIASILDRGLEYDLDQESIEQFLMTHESGMKVLLAPELPTDAARVSRELVEKVIDILAENYDFVVIDTAPDLVDTNVVALEKATKIVVPTTIDSSGLADIVKWTKIMEDADYATKARLVLTRIEKQNDFNYKEISGVVELPIIGRIPDDRKARSTMNNGELVNVFKTHTPFSEALKQVGQQLVPVFQTGKKGTPLRNKSRKPAKTKNQRRSLFSFGRNRG